MSKTFLFSMEDVNDNTDEVVNDTMASNIVEATDQAAEVEQSATVVEDHAEALDASVDGINEIDKTAEVLEKAVETGEGVSEDTAKIAEIVVESVCDRLGMRRGTAMSMESFGSKNTRLASTKIALESMKEKIAEAWKQIKAFFGRMYARVVEFVKKTWEAVVSIKNKAKDLAIRVKKATFEAGKYMLPEGYTNQKLADVIKGLKAEVGENSELAKSAAAVIAALESAAKKGDKEAVDEIIAQNETSISNESVKNRKALRKQRQEAANAILEAARNQKETDMSASATKATCEEAAAAAVEGSTGIPSEGEVTKSVEDVKKAADDLAGTAETEVKKAAETIDKNQDAAAVTEAKEKISMWNKIKTFTSKLYSYVSTAVTGIYRRLVAVTMFAFRFAWNLVKAAAVIPAVIAAAGVKGAYKAVVKGEY